LIEPDLTFGSALAETIAQIFRLFYFYKKRFQS